MATFDAAQRRALNDALVAGDRPPCPACGGALDLREVEPSGQVAYVRRRVWVLCPSCKRTAALDVRAAGPPSSRPDPRS